jgi:hypothetical protein
MGSMTKAKERSRQKTLHVGLLRINEAAWLPIIYLFCEGAVKKDVVDIRLMHELVLLGGGDGERCVDHRQLDNGLECFAEVDTRSVTTPSVP